MTRLAICIIKAITLVEQWSPNEDAEAKRKMVWQLIEMQCPNYLGDDVYQHEDIVKAINNLIDAIYIMQIITEKVTGKDLLA